MLHSKEVSTMILLKKKNGPTHPCITDLEEGTPSDKRPRGRADSKLNAKCDASTIVLQETLKWFIPTKEVSSEKKDKRKEGERGSSEELL